MERTQLSDTFEAAKRSDIDLTIPALWAARLGSIICFILIIANEMSGSILEPETVDEQRHKTIIGFAFFISGLLLALIASIISLHRSIRHGRQ